MKTLSKEIGLSKEYTNHCLRATCVTTLSNLGFNEREIMSITGHQSEYSLKHYTRVGSPQKKKLSEALSNFASTSSDVMETVDQSASASAQEQISLPSDLGLPDLNIITASQEAYINQSLIEQSKVEYHISNCVVNIYNK